MRGKNKDKRLQVNRWINKVRSQDPRRGEGMRTEIIVTGTHCRTGGDSSSSEERRKEDTGGN